MLQKMLNRKGFTLVELMIVVAIIGILAAIAIPNFLTFRMKAKTAEAKSNLGAIRSTEVTYFAEWDFYVQGGSINPLAAAGSPSGNKRVWNTAAATNTFSILGYAPEGNVFYTYQLADPAAALTYPTAGFTVQAIGDLDIDTILCSYTVNNSASEPARTGDDF